MPRFTVVAVQLGMGAGGRKLTCRAAASTSPEATALNTTRNAIAKRRSSVASAGVTSRVPGLPARSATVAAAGSPASSGGGYGWPCSSPGVSMLTRLTATVTSMSM